MQILIDYFLIHVAVKAYQFKHGQHLYNIIFYRYLTLIDVGGDSSFISALQLFRTFLDSLL